MATQTQTRQNAGKRSSSNSNRRSTADTRNRTIGNSLGAVSLALGGSEVTMPRTLADVSGLDQKYLPVLRAFGFREILSGVGLLASTNKTPWLWSRVIGDVLDSAFLGYAFVNEDDVEKRKKIVRAFVTISPIVLADLFAVLEHRGSQRR